MNAARLKVSLVAVIAAMAVGFVLWFVRTPTYSLVLAKHAYKRGEYRELRQYFDVEAVARSVGGFRYARTGSDLATASDLEWLSDFSIREVRVEQNTAWVRVENEGVTTQLRMERRGTRWCVVEIRWQEWVLVSDLDFDLVTRMVAVFLVGTVMMATVVVVVKWWGSRTPRDFPSINLD